MQATILLVFPLVLLYLFLSQQNKKTVPTQRPKQAEDTCAYCEISRNLH